ncbi:MAG: carbohydrate ABC transporter permease [Clostridiales bacterium]|nr:carbohydrate ABC transporter permease [Clostridiales bacterium]
MVEKKSISGIIFDVINYLLMAAIAFICVVPVIHVIWASVSDPAAVDKATSFILWPLGKPSLNAYRIILKYKNIWTGYKNTLFYVVAQCLITSVLTVIAGYITSRKRFRYRNILMMFLAFTMLFNGGMIPTYMVVNYLGLLDTRAALLIPQALIVFYIIIMRTAISGIPDSLEESARIDGAGEFTVMFKIILPLCKATFAVIILFIAVGKWNEWFPALLYLPQAKNKYPLQMFMREILISAQNSTSSVTQSAAEYMDNAQMYKTLVKYGAIVVSTLPILLIYPFCQKYFVTGVMIGSVKG